MVILIISDSRGVGLEQLLSEREDIEETRVLVHRGAGFIRAVTNSLESIRQLRPGMIMLHAGICDITTRNHRTKKTTLRYGSIQDTVNGVSAALARALDILNGEGYSRVPVATITGLDLNKYNKQYPTPRDTDQAKLNNAITEVNRMIIDSNKSYNIPTIWAASRVHAYYRGVYHNHYNRLSDGCHPNHDTLIYWAKMLAKAIKLMINR